MTTTNLLDYGLVLAYIAIILDMSMQIARVWKRKSAGDISILGTTIRALATMVFLTKYIVIQDPYLTIGQTIFMTLLLCYLIIIIKFRFNSLTLKRQNA